MQNLLWDGVNPFNLPAPPTWWLQVLAAYDPDLVVMPSATEPVYRLARRARKSPGVQLALNAGLVPPHPDTLRMARAKLVPVASMLQPTIWSLKTIEELAARDLWRHGGADRVNQLLLDQEARQRQRAKQALHDDLDRIGADAYASYKYRTGQRVSLVSTVARSAIHRALAAVDSTDGSPATAAPAVGRDGPIDGGPTAAAAPTAGKDNNTEGSPAAVSPAVGGNESPGRSLADTTPTPPDMCAV